MVLMIEWCHIPKYVNMDLNLVSISRMHFWKYIVKLSTVSRVAKLKIGGELYGEVLERYGVREGSLPSPAQANINSHIFKEMYRPIRSWLAMFWNEYDYNRSGGWRYLWCS